MVRCGAPVLKHGSNGSMQLFLSLEATESGSSCVAKASVLKTIGCHCKEVLCLSGLAPVLHSLKGASSSLQGPCVNPCAQPMQLVPSPAGVSPQLCYVSARQQALPQQQLCSALRSHAGLSQHLWQDPLELRCCPRCMAAT